MEKKAIVAILAITILSAVVLPAAFSFDRHDVDVICDASEDYEANKEECKELYDEVKEQEDDSESEKWNEKDYKEAIKEKERSAENDLKDDEDEDSCYYEGIRVDNDNSFCD